MAERTERSPQLRESLLACVGEWVSLFCFFRGTNERDRRTLTRGLLLTLLLAMTTLSCGGDDRSSAASPSLQEADAEALKEASRGRKVCVEHRPPPTEDQQVVLVVPTTAGAITESARKGLERTLAPWNSLARDHFVVSCGYAPAERSVPGPRVTACPDGTVYPLDRQPQYLVDEDGRWSVDEVSFAVPPCPDAS